MQEILTGAAAAVLTYGVVYFIGKPVVKLEQKRLEALQTADHYFPVDAGADQELRDKAMEALLEAGTALHVLERGWSTAVRLWCWVWKYDLNLAAQILFGLAEGPRGVRVVPQEVRKNTKDALYVALNAYKHLSPETVEGVRQMIAQTKAAPRQTVEAESTEAGSTEATSSPS
jgi:hypothetical protein